MKRIVIVGNTAKPAVAGAAERVARWLDGRAEVSVDLDMESLPGRGEVDYGLVLGGDGLMLLAGRAFAPIGVPIMGINVGKLGFLTETTLEDFEGALGDMLEGRCTVLERMTLACALERAGRPVLEATVINDAVVARTSASRMVTIDFSVDGELVATYRADGIIVATPMGSTAYSLAAGGPILHPELEALVVTPICPHSLTNRPLVLPAGRRVSVEAREWAEAPALTVDGQVSRSMRAGDVVRVRRADAPVRLVCTGRNRFFETLRSKLDWRGQPRYVRQEVRGDGSA
jgi:NAD+ kinase